MAGKGQGWFGDPEGHSRAGQKGGRKSSGNFKNNPERAKEAGRKGGRARSKNRSIM